MKAKRSADIPFRKREWALSGPLQSGLKNPPSGVRRAKAETDKALKDLSAVASAKVEIPEKLGV
jgi:hypothetical protein